MLCNLVILFAFFFTSQSHTQITQSVSSFPTSTPPSKHHQSASIEDKSDREVNALYGLISEHSQLINYDQAVAWESVEIIRTINYELLAW